MLQMEVLSNTMTVTSLQYINISQQYVVHYKFTEYYMYVNYSSIKLKKVKYNIIQYKQKNVSPS